MSPSSGGTYSVVPIDGASLYLRTPATTPMTRWFLAPMIYDPEDVGDMFLRNDGLHTDYTALYPRRWQHS
jgi:hypothetical protein